MSKTQGTHLYRILSSVVDREREMSKTPKPRICRAQEHDVDGWICYVMNSEVPTAFGQTPQRAFQMLECFLDWDKDLPFEPEGPEIIAWLDGCTLLQSRIPERDYYEG